MSLNPSQCPLCGSWNNCQLSSFAAYKGPCWCQKVKIPEELLAQIPAEYRNHACICRACVLKFHRAKMNGAPALKVRPGDFYFDAGLMVFTAAYHLRRGFCCDGGCRHCPYETAPNPFAVK